MVDDESKKLFLKAMVDVKPLNGAHQNKVNLSKAKKINKVRIKQNHSQIESSLNKNDFIDVMSLSAESFLNCQKQLSNKVFSDLKKGKFAIEACLDLHKYTCAQASQAIIDFIRECCKRSINCALIVHGKGQGLVKGVTESILSRSADGGTGSVYILL